MKRPGLSILVAGIILAGCQSYVQPKKLPAPPPLSAAEREKLVDILNRRCVANQEFGDTSAEVEANCECISPIFADYFTEPSRQRLLSGRKADPYSDQVFYDHDAGKAAVARECPAAYAFWQENE